MTGPAQRQASGALPAQAAAADPLPGDTAALLAELAALRAAVRKQAQLETLVDQLREANEHLVLATVNAQAMRDEADATNRRQTEFLAMLAHELRNPLAPISSAAQLLEMLEVKEPRVRQVSAIVNRQVGHMTRLLDDLLDVSRVTRGLVTLANERLDLDAIVDGAVEQVRPLVEQRRHTLVLQMAAQPVAIVGDRTRMVQILANLLANAAKYTPEGGRIRLAVETAEGSVTLRVTDNGMGIEPELLPHVFDLFIQAKRSPDRSQGGLGLGLALVRSLVAQHGGQVRAESAGLGQGSVFTVSLPTVKEALAGTATLADGPAHPAARQKVVMVVDDNVDAAQTVGMWLEGHGHSVSLAYSAADALALAAGAVPDVMIIDIGLPDMDGYELCRRLRQHPQTRQAVLIALTGYGQAQDRDHARSAGFDHHLTKPADLSRILALAEQTAAAGR